MTACFDKEYGRISSVCRATALEQGGYGIQPLAELYQRLQKWDLLPLWIGAYHVREQNSGNVDVTGELVSEYLTGSNGAIVPRD